MCVQLESIDAAETPLEAISRGPARAMRSVQRSVHTHTTACRPAAGICPDSSVRQISALAHFLDPAQGLGAGNIPFMGNVQLPTTAGGSGASSSAPFCAWGWVNPYPFDAGLLVSAGPGGAGGRTGATEARLAAGERPGGGGGGGKAAAVLCGLPGVGDGLGGTARAEAPLEARERFAMARAAGLIPVGRGGGASSSSLS